MIVVYIEETESTIKIQQAPLSFIKRILMLPWKLIHWVGHVNRSGTILHLKKFEGDNLESTYILRMAEEEIRDYATVEDITFELIFLKG